MAEEDEIIREVNDALKQERWQKMWKQYGGKLLLSAVLLMMGLAGWVVYKQQQQYQQEDYTTLMMQGRKALMSDKLDDARDAFVALQKEASGQWNVLASFWLAKVEMADADDVAARDALAQVVQHEEPVALVRLACLQGRMLDGSDDRFAECLAVKQAAADEHAPTPAFSPLVAEWRAVQLAKEDRLEDALNALPSRALPMSQQQRVSTMEAYWSSSQVVGDAKE